MARNTPTRHPTTDRPLLSSQFQSQSHDYRKPLSACHSLQLAQQTAQASSASQSIEIPQEAGQSRQARLAVEEHNPPTMANSATTTKSVGVERRKPANAGADSEIGTNGAATAAQAQAEADAKERDFFWTYTEEPHRTRRLAIIKAHPEVRMLRRRLAHIPKLGGAVLVLANESLLLQVTKLCGPEPLTKYVVAFVVALQIFCGYLLKDTSFWSWKFWALAYVVGATANQNTFLAIHEISHNLAFRSPLANRLFAIFANFPIGLPYSASFRVSPHPSSVDLPMQGHWPVADDRVHSTALPFDPSQVSWR